MYPETHCHATHCTAHLWRVDSRGLYVFQLSVSFDELFGPAAGKAHRQATVVVIPLDTHNRAYAIVWVAYFSPEQWIGVPAAFYRASPECARTLLVSLRC